MIYTLLEIIVWFFRCNDEVDCFIPIASGFAMTVYNVPCEIAMLQGLDEMFGLELKGVKPIQRDFLLKQPENGRARTAHGRIGCSGGI